MRKKNKKTSNNYLKIRQLSISRRAFWDINFEELEPTQHKEYIIRKVFERGKWNDIVNVIKFYSYDVTLEILKNLDSLNEKGLQIASVVFNTSKKEFKCYTNKLFRPSCLKH